MLKIELYMDGANVALMHEAYCKKAVQGFTTNPTLMRAAGIVSYAGFAISAIKAIPDLPISFEVFSDEFDGMEKEAEVIASWGGDTYTKIPITNTRGNSSIPLIKKLSNEGHSLNITAILTLDQVQDVVTAVNPNARTIISVFAGRMADTGVDPIPVMKQAKKMAAVKKNIKLLWASSRELLNIFHAEEAGCDIITLTPDILKKLPLIGKNLTQFSQETVKMFYDDACRAGYNITAESAVEIPG